MIKQLRKKLIIAAMLSLFIVLLVTLGAVNIVSYRKVVRDSDGILMLLSENGGTFPAQSVPMAPPEGDGMRRGMAELSPETPYESRFFTVEYNSEGEIVRTDTSQIISVDSSTAAEYAANAMSEGSTSGFLGDFRYLLSETENGGKLAVFLDCSRALSSFRSTLISSIAVSVIGLTAVFILLFLLSGRIIRPVAESYEKQKRFITDAGHELKTPLTIIGADTDLAELESGESEWLTDIRRQAERLTTLTNELIYLSRMEEEQPELQLIDFPISDMVEETAQSFLAPARLQGKELIIDVQPMLSYVGDEKAINRLVSILLDNALKYSPTGAELKIALQRQQKALLLTVSNPTVKPIEREKLAQLFDRFYRTDASRNSGEGGYGLGLSIAKSVVSAHKGKIRAESPDGAELVISAELPIR